MALLSIMKKELDPSLEWQKLAGTTTSRNWAFPGSNQRSEMSSATDAQKLFIPALEWQSERLNIRLGLEGRTVGKNAFNKTSGLNGEHRSWGMEGGANVSELWGFLFFMPKTGQTSCKALRPCVFTEQKNGEFVWSNVTWQGAAIMKPSEQHVCVTHSAWWSQQRVSWFNWEWDY